jgi:hypothetical protein
MFFFDAPIGGGRLWLYPPYASENHRVGRATGEPHHTADA